MEAEDNLIKEEDFKDEEDLSEDVFHAKKEGHSARNYYYNGQVNQNNGFSASTMRQGSSMNNNAILMVSNSEHQPITRKLDEYTPDIWIADTGASCHITNNDTGMFNTQTLKDDYITVADDHNI